jgi:hypothetical protein
VGLELEHIIHISKRSVGDTNGWSSEKQQQAPHGKSYKNDDDDDDPKRASLHFPYTRPQTRELQNHNNCFRYEAPEDGKTTTTSKHTM